MNEQDNKTLQEGATALQYVDSEGWQIVKGIFEAKIMDLQSIKNLVGTNPDELLADIKARNTAVDILIEIIGTIEGKANQFKANALPQEESSNIILRR